MASAVAILAATAMSASRYENRKMSDGARTKLLVEGAERKRSSYKQPA
jgi:hypothetical protein